MSDTVQIATAILAFLSTCLTAVLAYLMKRLDTKAAAAAIRTEEVAAKVEVVHKATNSIKDALVEATDRAARSEGYEAGRSAGRDSLISDPRPLLPVIPPPTPPTPRRETP